MGKAYDYCVASSTLKLLLISISMYTLIFARQQPKSNGMIKRLLATAMLIPAVLWGQTNIDLSPVSISSCCLTQKK